MALPAVIYDRLIKQESPLVQYNGNHYQKVGKKLFDMDDNFIVRKCKKMCVFGDCQRLAIYGKFSDQVRLYCRIHKTADTTYLRKNRCKYQSCYNPVKNDEEYCVVHCNATVMRNNAILHKSANVPKAIPLTMKKYKMNNNYYYDDSALPAFVYDKFMSEESPDLVYEGKYYKKIGRLLFDLENNLIRRKGPKLCVASHCVKMANYGYYSDKKRLYCNIHKPNDAVNLWNPQCKYSNCAKNAQKNGKYCLFHFYAMEKCQMKRCEKEGCEELAFWGELFEGKRHCNLHKELNEIKDPDNPFQDSYYSEIKPSSSPYTPRMLF